MRRRGLRRDQRLGVGLERPAHRVLDLSGRVRLGEHLAEEELREARPGPGASGARSSAPSPRSCRARPGTPSCSGSGRSSRSTAAPTKTAPATRSGWSAARPSSDPRSEREPDRDRSVHPDRVQDRDGVRDELGVVVRRGARPAGPNVRCREGRRPRPGRAGQGRAPAASRSASGRSTTPGAAEPWSARRRAPRSRGGRPTAPQSRLGRAHGRARDQLSRARPRTASLRAALRRPG